MCLMRLQELDDDVPAAPQPEARAAAAPAAGPAAAAAPAPSVAAAVLADALALTGVPATLENAAKLHANAVGLKRAADRMGVRFQGLYRVPLPVLRTPNCTPMRLACSA